VRFLSYMIELYDRVSKVTEDVIRTLYIPDKLKDWEDLNSFPAYMKSSHQIVYRGVLWILLYRLTAAIAGFINRVTPDWSRVKN